MWDYNDFYSHTLIYTPNETSDTYMCILWYKQYKLCMTNTRQNQSVINVNKHQNSQDEDTFIPWVFKVNKKDFL